MKADLINPFLYATINVLRTMGKLTPKPGEPKVKKNKTAYGDITGIIGLTGDTEGSMSLTFSETCALTLAENMTGEKFEEINDKVADMVGELTNMISGDARAQLEDQGLSFSAAIPTIVRGKNHTVDHIVEGGATVFFPFSTDSGDLFVEACFAPSEKMSN